MKARPLYHTFYIIVFFIFLVSGCSVNDSIEPGIHPRVALIGLDGATWKIIDRLIELGQLPGFARIKSEGSFGELATYEPTESVSIWTSIATGVSPSRHGVQTFTRRIPGTDQTVPSPGTDRRVPALWNIVSDANRKVVCVKWFATWPAEKVNGAMLSPRLEADSGGDQTYPPELFQEISPFRYKSTMDKLPQPPKKISQPKTNNFKGPGILIGKNTVKVTMFDDTSVWLAGRYVDKKYSPDLFMIYMKSVDRVEHFLWGAQQVLDNPNATDVEKQEAEVIFGWYRFFDSIISELLKDPDRTIFIVSDHGMVARDSVSEPYDIYYINLDSILCDLGFQKKVNDQQTDWSQTNAYVLRRMPYDKSFLVNLNLKDREPRGIISSEQKKEALENLTEVLRSLQTLTGKKLFSDISTDRPDCDIYCQLNPRINLNDTVRYNKKMFLVKDWVEGRQLPRGIHTKAPPGIIAAWGKNIKKANIIHGAHVFDITPTVLYAMGLPVANDFDGKCLLDIFRSRFRNNFPLQKIPTYGTRNTRTEFKRTAADDRMKNELRKLGYIL